MAQFNRPISRALIEPQLENLLRQHNLITAKDVLQHSILDLMELLNITYAQACSLHQALSAHISPPYATAHELLQERRIMLRTSLPILDDALRQGLPAGSITELVGPAGVGKSQLSFMLALLAAAPAECSGLGGVVFYVDTEKKFSSTRLAEVARSRFPQHLSSGPALAAMLSRILVISPNTTDELLQCLYSLEQAIIERQGKLVVVDSIAALARTEFSGKAGLMERQELLGKAAAQLKYLAESFKIPVVVTNQVTTRLQAPGTHDFQQATGRPSAAGRQQEQQQQQQQQQGYLTAALGTKWAHAVNVRLILERVADHRYLKVAKSPASANVILEYIITPRGLEQVMDAVVPAWLQQSMIDIAIANELDYGMDF